MSDQDEVAKLLRDSKAGWQQDGFGLRGPPTVFEPKSSERVPIPPFEVKELENKTLRQSTGPLGRKDLDPFYDSGATGDGTAGTDLNVYSFKLIKPTVAGGNVTMVYGEINGLAPTEMSGGNDYTFTVAAGNEVYAIVTYDTSTLAITSRTIGWGGSVPDSSSGILYIPLGYVNISGTTISPHNRQCGDINICFSYGDDNGQPALLFLNQYDDPIDLM